MEQNVPINSRMYIDKWLILEEFVVRIRNLDLYHGVYKELNFQIYLFLKHKKK